MNHLIKYFFLSSIILLASSCYKDQSSLGNKPISEISILLPDISEGQVVNREKNDLLTIDPEITQSGHDKSLTYEWQVNYEVFSTDETLEFPCTQLGTYFIRLKVTNEDGSAFTNFTLNVNSPYEEGLMVLSEDEGGEGTLAFMRKYSQADLDAGKVESFVNNVFTLNNPGEKIGKRPTDIVKRENQVFVSSAGEGKIYLLNAKTFEVESTVSAPDIPGFRPVRMNIPDGAFRTASILCEEGKIYTLAMLEHLVMTDAKFDQPVIEKTDFGFNFNDCFSYFWDNEHSRILQYSAYYPTSSLDEFAGQELVSFFYDGANLNVVTRDENDPSEYTNTVFGNYVQNVSTQDLDLKQKTTLNVSGTPELTPLAPTVVNTNLKKLLYASGSNVYSWFYTGTTMQSTPFITIDNGTITALAQDPDENLLYVGVYDAGASGLKGSIYIYNPDSGKLVEKYMNVTDKPVKIFYKQKN